MHPQHPQGEERVVNISSQFWWSGRQKCTGRSGCTLVRQMFQPLAHGTYIFGVRNVQCSLEGQEMLNRLGHGRLLCYIVREAKEEGQMPHSVGKVFFHLPIHLHSFMHAPIHAPIHLLLKLYA